MKAANWEEVTSAREAALEVLRHNSRGPFHGLPRTAGWGYAESYTRDLLISILGIAVSGDQKLMGSTRKVLTTLAENQSELGHIPSMVHDRENKGSSDTTPLFLLGIAIFRIVSGEEGFLHEAVEKALTWMEHQSPTSRFLVAQLPTSDWRDEQWVLGYGLFVNTLVYSYLQMLNQHERADNLRKEMERFAIDLPPNFFPFTKPGDPDWRERYSVYNKPGEYHNGGIWPFVCGIYIAALVASKMYRLAGEKLLVLTRAIRASSSGSVDFGFNEWLKAVDGKPAGQDWQTWSAALYLYAVKCVEEKRTPFFEEMRD